MVGRHVKVIRQELRSPGHAQAVALTDIRRVRCVLHGSACRRPILGGGTGRRGSARNRGGTAHHGSWVRDSRRSRDGARRHSAHRSCRCGAAGRLILGFGSGPLRPRRMVRTRLRSHPSNAAEAQRPLRTSCFPSPTFSNDVADPACPRRLLAAKDGERFITCGLPVVATMVGGVPEIARDGETALLVRSRDESAMARAVDALLGDRARAARLGAAAERSVLRYHTPEQRAATLSNLYSALVSGQGQHGDRACL
jgi:hypothetical protein